MIAIEPKRWLGLNGMTMKYKFSGIALGLAVAAGAQAQTSSLNFLQKQSFDVSNYFASSTSSPFSNGSTIQAMASDGTSLYVAGYRAGSGEGSVGVIRIDNPTSSTPTYTQIYSVSAAGTARASRLVFSNGNLFFGYGMGGFDSSLSSTSSGIVKLTGITGATATADSTFSSGLLSMQEARNDSSAGGRIDAFDVDPISGNLFINAFSNGLSYVVNSNTGSFIGTYSISAPTGFRTQHRDMAFGPDGTLYGRTVGSTGQGDAFASGSIITKWNTRTDPSGSSAGSFTGQTYISTQSGLGASSTSRIQVIGGSAIDSSLASTGLFLYNDQLSTGANGNTLVINDLATNAELFRIRGNEANGTAPGAAGLAFGSSTLTSTFAKIGGLNYLFVSESTASRDTVRVYEVVPEPASMIAVGVGAAALLRRRKKTA